MKLINIYGGPGIGKSTFALGLTYRMKCEGLDVEYVSEVAKDLLYAGVLKSAFQVDIYLEQLAKIRNIQKYGTEYVVCDSPLLLNLIYNADNTTDEFKAAVVATYREFDNIDVTLQRTFPYVQKGRIHTEKEALQVDESIEHVLKKHSMNGWYVFDPNEIEILLSLIIYKVA